jgi:hypothetical protein
MVHGIMNRMPVRWIIYRRCAYIYRWYVIWRCIVNRRIVNWCIKCGTIVITNRKVYARLKIPRIIGIKIKMTWVIITVNINMTIDHHVIFIKFLLRWLTLMTINFLSWLDPCRPKLGIATCQGDEQREEYGAFE